jgi:hypothetical protein
LAPVYRCFASTSAGWRMSIMISAAAGSLMIAISRSG